MALFVSYNIREKKFLLISKKIGVNQGDQNYCPSSQYVK